MSNYGSMPPPGPYTPPAQGTPTPGQNAQPQQQQQNYQAGAPSQARSGHKSGVYGQMMQAVNTGKPMLDKLGKTISSKLSGKPAAGGPPQHLQSYQNYQQHQGQGQGQGQYGHSQGFQQQPQQQYQGQTYSPQPQQQQWQHPPHPQQPAGPPPPQAYTAQPSPYQHSNYATPVSGNSGQSNYFPAQPPSTVPPTGTASHNQPPHNAGGNTGSEQQYAQQGHYGQQIQSQGQYQQAQQTQQHQQMQSGQYAGQQTGVVGTPGTGYLQSGQMSHMGDVSPEIPPNKPVQWSNAPSPALQPPGPPPQSYQTVPSPPVSHVQQQQQWNSPSPMTPQGQGPPPPTSPPPHPVSPPPQQIQMPPQPAPSVPSQPAQPPTPVSKPAAAEAAPTEFIAELPGDMGNMNLGGPSAQVSAQYQAYQPAGGEQPTSPTNRFSVPRRAISASSLPLADPWRFADPITEQPTREFYLLADLIFETLDRKFEPQNTGLMEAPKVLKCWNELTAEAHELFSHNNYNALARMWSLEGIPHVLVPVQASLAPIWHFNQHSHAQELMIVSELQSAPATYMPALNRAGWYKYFFLEMIHGPDEIGKLLSTLCADTYKPGVLNQPDLNRRDRSSIPALQQRAAQIQSMAIKYVCDEAKHAMQRKRNGAAAAAMMPQNAGPSSVQPGSSTDMAGLMHEIQMASNDIAVRSVAQGDTMYENRPGGYNRVV